MFVAWSLCRSGDAAAVPTFMGLGDLPGGSFQSVANAVSADGSTVVGRGIGASGTEAFRWTIDGGMVGLGDLPGGEFRSVAFGVSADGSAVVGESSSESSQLAPQAFRWTIDGGMVPLGDLTGGSFQSSANAVSADGSTVVGYGWTASDRGAFRWTSVGGMLALPGGNGYAEARGISADGSTIVGSRSAALGSEAFRWTNASGTLGLGIIPGGGGGFGGFASEALDVSADGSTVVGVSAGVGRFNWGEAFRWTSDGGMVGLGDLPDGPTMSRATAVSGDGSTVVGFGESAEHTAAFIWDETHGMRELQPVLVDLGLGASLAGWTLAEAYGISDDGLTIVGVGTNPQGEWEAWIAVIPEPGTASLLGVGLIGLSAARRMRTRPRRGR